MSEHNQLATTSPLAIQTYDEMERMAKHVAESQLFGITKASQAMCLFALCQAEGLNPITALRRYHLIEGRPSMRADAIQGEFQARGGGIIFHVRTEEMVCATFFIDKTKIDDEARARAAKRFDLMWQFETEPADSKKRPALMVELGKLSRDGEETVLRTFANAVQTGLAIGNNGNIKANWERNKRAMLTARTVSEGVRVIDPGLIAGIYTPEETVDIVEQEREEWATNAEAKDERAIEAMIAQHLEDAAATKDPDRKRKLLGLVADLRLKLQELNDSPTATHTPNGKGEPRTAEPPDTKQEAKPDNSGSAVFPEDWRNVECHVGLAGGPILGKKVGDMFPTTQTEKHRASLLKWFTNWYNGLTTKTAQDEILWQAIQKAVSVPPQAQSEPPATTEPAAQQTQPQTPQRARTGAEWENFVIESKLKKFNGRQLGDLYPDELADFNQKLDGVDWTKATLKQKKTRAMVALALDAIKGEPEPEYADPQEPEYADPQHITELRQNLEKSKIPVEVFMAECVKAGWIDPDRKALEEITETEARPLLDDFQTVAEQCDGVTV